MFCYYSSTCRKLPKKSMWHASNAAFAYARVRHADLMFSL
ncbi:hypothetical protein [Polaromonas sp. CG9_12]|nr:hypothetical protein [Polaromonas sp. CG9_12]